MNVIEGRYSKFVSGTEDEEWGVDVRMGRSSVPGEVSEEVNGTASDAGVIEGVDTGLSSS